MKCRVAKGKAKNKGEKIGVYARISTSRFNECIARLYAAAFLRLFDHAQGYSVLDAPTRVEELDLGVDFGLNSQRLGDLIETN